MQVFATGGQAGTRVQWSPALHSSSTLNVIARALKRSNLAISDRLKPPLDLRS